MVETRSRAKKAEVTVVSAAEKKSSSPSTTTATTTAIEDNPLPTTSTPAERRPDAVWNPAKTLQTTYCLVTLVLYIGYCVLYTDNYLHQLRKLVGSVVAYVVLHALYYFTNFHQYFGIWKCKEPKSHFNFSMATSWIVALFMTGEISRKIFYYMEDTHLEQDVVAGVKKVVLFEVEDKYKFIKSHSFAEDVFWGIVGFYAIDFLRYWAHRLGHRGFFYKTFPFSHAHHHNQIFVNPLTTIMSPLWHFASLATYTPPFLLGILGLHRAAAISLLICAFPNWTQHLGCDPFPWLTRWNHYYFYGALPWIPLYHSYHHNPFIATGNFGNTTVLFDYVYGTLQPESVYHIEHGKPLEKVAKWFQDEEKLDRVLKSMYEGGGGKDRMDLNEKGFDFSKEMFSMHYL